jgi:hypothetical protein
VVKFRVGNPKPKIALEIRLQNSKPKIALIFGADSLHFKYYPMKHDEKPIQT